MLLKWTGNHNFIKGQVPVLRSRVKENRVGVPGDPVTVSGEQFCKDAIVQEHEKAQESFDP